ncbi:hypothetical protein [Roseofilum casamattae]|uniref:Type II secretion system protein GspE N-terminal domain-containing protein n=1 Tax=Roseofilum casamattae BLCC-M143 TaxID=3022442 RepID=A0ABT7BTD2_9CYAN|nr:hypothetical protein [Roseofilum casamattae]MDJ1182315.1 hypothetical protein [Roseofilum casamattae BLCC-M143]
MSISLSSPSLSSLDINVDSLFPLIDRLLSFEACLYHQVLPLSLEGSSLRLGMVDLDDTSALDYCRQILSYLHCSVVAQHISTDLHQSMLKAYLNHVSSQSHLPSALPEPIASPSNVEATQTEEDMQVSQETANQVFEHWPERPTLILEGDEIIELRQEAIAPSHTSAPKAPSTAPPAPPSRSCSKRVARHQNETADLQGLPELKIQGIYLSSPIEILAELPPSILWQELLSRVLGGGIGRLFFERHANGGRILWSLNGVVQSVLENLPLEVFKGVINELKLLTHLPLISIKQTKEVEIERFYRSERLLLRLRVMPGEYGEDATLQVLRGAALKFHQRQQLTNLGRDAVAIADQLQKKLNEIRDRTDKPSAFSGKELDSLTTLHNILDRLTNQVRELETRRQQWQETEGNPAAYNPPI